MECQNALVASWVQDVAKRLEPSEIRWVNGSEEERAEFTTALVEDGTFTPCDEEKYPNCYWSRSDPNDVARVEDRTFICSNSPSDCGPTNNWCDPKEMYQKLDGLMAGCMKGRTMYVVPYLMGPDGSPYSKVGFEVTDSLYVVLNMRIMARIGNTALRNLKDDSNDFVRGVHSVGTLNPEERFICHFPEDNTIISFSSGYGGNALQGKKCFALRIASAQARREGWLAEHMLILGITNPQGKKSYVCAAFPSACGKTNLAMLIPPEKYQKEGWKIETVGDDIAWLNFGEDGQLYAINPEAGFFGVAPGTSEKTNPSAIASIKENTIFTNTAFDPEARVPWWDKLTKDTPSKLTDWKGNDWTPESDSEPAHPNSRFTAPASQCPTISPEWESPNGVPISAIIFGGRRAHSAPLVYEALNWQHGVFVGVTMASETTAAAAGKIGELRRDPMAMKPFIGYHAGDYFQHWLDMGNKDGAKMPKVYHVNWFRTNSKGDFLWPGFGDNMRVLEWIVNRIDGEAGAVETALGNLPTPQDLNVEGLDISNEQLEEILTVKPEEWTTDIESQRVFFQSIGDKLPKEIMDEHERLRVRLGV